MDITRLRYFLKTAETLNYTRAAAELFITRQSLRQALGTLEQEVGVPLFENEKNHLSLTEYGEFLAFSAEDVVRRFDALAAELDRFAHQKTPLRVAYSESLVPFILPDFEMTLKDFRSKYPHIPLDARSLPSDEVVDALHAEEIDCGILLQMPTVYPNCETELLHTFPVAVGSGAKSALYPKKTVTLQELASVPLVGMGSLEKIARPLWEDCQREKLTLNYQVMPNTVDAFYHIQHSLASGLDIYFEDETVPDGCGLLPGYTWELAMLRPIASPVYGMARLFCRYIEGRYRQRLNEPL